MSDAKKDTIYIDTEDDITAIIGRVKSAKLPIVALVPPKRIGALQSIVNLKLLNRAAETSKKRIVLITNDRTLTALAAGLSIPVAKNLQSKPEIPETALSDKNDTEDDVINGAELPVGELQKTAEVPVETSPVKDTPPSAPVAMKTPVKSKTSTGIPNFDSFRKRLLIFGALGIFLVAFLVWAIWFAGSASIAIKAKTTVMNISKQLQVRPGATLDAEKAVVPAVVKEMKKTVTTQFGATGKKDVGTKATGTVTFSTDSFSLLKGQGTTIAAGTSIQSSSGATYRTDESVTLTTANDGVGKTAITAIENGDSYNGASGSASGAPSGISTKITTATSGGTSKTISIVSDDDVKNARAQLQTQVDNEVGKAKAELIKQFTPETMVIQESFKSALGNSSSSPAVGQEAANAALSAEATYKMVAVKRSDLKAVYDAHVLSQIDKKTQKIYRSGEDKTTFMQFGDTDGGFSVKAQASSQVGPNINEQQLAATLTGKRAGEIQEMIQRIQGVDNVDVHFSPFWVTKAPSDLKKIDIKFVVKDEQ